MSDERAKATYLAVVPFVADDDRDAELAVSTMAEGLGILCPAVDYYRAQVQGLGDAKPRDVFCGAPGPELEQSCVHPVALGEHLWHHDGFDRWTDADVPSAPDSADGLDS